MRVAMRRMGVPRHLEAMLYSLSRMDRMRLRKKRASTIQPRVAIEINRVNQLVFII